MENYFSFFFLAFILIVTAIQYIYLNHEQLNEGENRVYVYFEQTYKLSIDWSGAEWMLNVHKLKITPIFHVHVAHISK